MHTMDKCTKERAVNTHGAVDYVCMVLECIVAAFTGADSVCTTECIFCSAQQPALFSCVKDVAAYVCMLLSDLTNNYG
jgi:hypothetical protein